MEMLDYRGGPEGSAGGRDVSRRKLCARHWAPCDWSSASPRTPSVKYPFLVGRIIGLNLFVEGTHSLNKH